MNPGILEDRLIDFTVSIIFLARHLNRTYAGTQLSNQITRASISASLNYGEAQLAESKKDFVHKVKLTLKELKEVHVGMKICIRAGLLKSTIYDTIMKESNELVSIFVRTADTASKSLSKRHPPKS